MGADYQGAWLSAQAALGLVAFKYRRAHDAQAALVESAAYGAVVAKCRESRIETEAGQTLEWERGGEIATEFWRCLQEPLGNSHEDWTSGNFTAKYRAKAGHWQWTRVRGVEFSRDGLLAYFGLDNSPAVKPPASPPPPPRSIVHQPSAAPLPAETKGQAEREWIPAADAVDMVLPLYGSAGQAQAALISEAAASRLSTRCERFEHENENPRLKSVFKPTLTELEAKFWRDFEFHAREREDWMAGAFVFRVGGSLDDMTWTRAFGVEFHADDICRVFRLAPSMTESERQAANLEGWGKLAKALEPAIQLAGKVRAAQPPSGSGLAAAAEYITYDEVWAWYRSLPLEDQARPWRWLWNEIRTAHAPRQVYKKHALTLVEGRRRGRRKNVPEKCSDR